MISTNDTISIRLTTPADGPALTRLAALDGTTVPAGPILVAEREGHLQAALSLTSGDSMADPFVPTAALLDLLRVRVASLLPPRSPRRLSFRPWLRHSQPPRFAGWTESA